jgi:hypothetical protein
LRIWHSMNRDLGWTFLLALLATLTAAVAGGDMPGPDEFFEKEVRPILAERCQKCHGEAKPKGGLQLTSRAAVLAGGDSGPAAVAGQPEESLLVQAIRYHDEPRMPPKERLPDREVEALTRWVALGLPWPAAKAEIATPQGTPYRITEEQRRFWSFQPIKAVSPPEVKDAAWPRTAIDRFILAALEAKGLAPAPPADKRTLIRRATFDLTGLPPSPEEVRAFLADESPEAFARVVDRLLASPRYGQRWGRHWLDVVRYADSRDARGIGGADDIAEAWRYRDWVVDAFNRGLPYDRFVIDQIAGDRMPAGRPGEVNAEGLVATGLLTIGEWGTGDADKEKMMTDIVDDQVDVVGRAFLGLTIACARCHDHKFDPIPTADYYGLAGIFFSTHILPEPGAKTAGSPLLRTPLVPRATIDAAERYKVRVAELERKIKAEGEAATSALARSLLPETSRYLLAAWDFSRRPADQVGLSPDEYAAAHGLHPAALRRWLGYLGLGDDGRPLAEPASDVHGAAGVFGWHGGPADPSATINTTDKEVTLLSFRLPPRSVSVHPGPTRPVVVAWRSPIAGTVRVAGRLADSDPNGGDGVAWAIEHRRGSVALPLAAGDVPNGGAQRFDQGRGADRLGAVEVRAVEVLRLVVAPKASHTCDTTAVELTITAADGAASWDLAGDLVADPLRGNPHADRLGHADVWQFSGLDATRPERPADSPLAAWDRAAMSGDRAAIEDAAGAIQRAVDGPDSKLRDELTAPRGPFGFDGRADVADLPPEVRASLAKLRDELADLRRNPPPPIPLALAAQEGGVPKSAHEGIHDARIHVRGSYLRLGPVVPRHFPRVLAGDDPPPIAEGSGRLELARWIARADHPLTARVMANRIWQYHFGEGLVRTPSNFGKLGERPTHPELLDHLARTFIEGGWSIKAMHRAIMLSSAYQQSSRPAPETLRADPENRLFDRMNRRRLEAEALRDALLAVAGRLDDATGGPAYRDLATPRRTLYLMTIRSDRSSYGPLFDSADATAIVDRRTVSTVAPQALFLLNNPFALDQAKALARRVAAEGPPDDRGRIAWAYQVVYGRPPTGEEVEVGLEALAGAAEDRASSWEAYCQVLLCANEFIYID